jgi:hypothetical protein
LTRTPERGYRFSAEVRQDDSVERSDVGVFFGYSKTGKEGYWCELTFADLGELSQQPPDRMNGGTSCVGLRLIHEEPTPDGGVEFGERSVTRVAKMFPPITNKWRLIFVEVRAGLVRVNWEGEAIGETTDRDLEEFRFNAPKPEIPISFFHFDPHGALGLYVNRGTASFRNVQVEPLP